jgi:hypothetical protein
MKITSWNRTVLRFLDPPRFTWEPIGDATFYRARVARRGGEVIWEGTLESEALDFRHFWERIPIGEVAWAVTAWGAEGQPFGETGVRRFHRVAEWSGPSEPPDPAAWRRAAERNLAFLEQYRGPELGCFHRDAPSGTLAVPRDPSAPPVRWHESVIEGRYLSALFHPLRDLPAVIDGYLAAAVMPAFGRAATCLERAVEAGELLMRIAWREEAVPVIPAARAAASLLRLAYLSHRPEFEERGLEIARFLGERQGSDGAWPSWIKLDAVPEESRCPRVAATPALLLEDVAATHGEASCEGIAHRARSWLRAGPMRTHEWWATIDGEDPGVEDLSDLGSSEPLSAIRLLLTDPAAGDDEIEEARLLHRWVENVFVTYGEDESLGEEPHLPAARENAGDTWVRECAWGRWLDTLGMLYGVTGDPGYRERGDAAAGALTRSQRPDGRFASFGLDRRLGQSGRNEDRFGDNAIAAAALLRWLHVRGDVTGAGGSGAGG